MMKRLLSLTVLTALAALDIFTLPALAGGDVPAEASGGTYASYIAKYANAPSPDEPVAVDLQSFEADPPDYARLEGGDAENPEKSVRTADSGYIEWTVDVEAEGLYNICIDYYTHSGDGKGSAIIRSLLIDGELPFDEAGSLSFSRVFTNERPVKYDGNGDVIREFEMIGDGNEIRPTQVEVPARRSQYITEITGYYNTPFKFYFSKDTHRIRLESIREPLTVCGIKLCQSEEIKSYAQIEQDYKIKGYKEASGQIITIQGENAVLKSDSAIYPIPDYSSPSTQPSIPGRTMLNTIGGSRWQTNLQWVEWNFYVPQSGLYKLGIKARQDKENGQPSYRKLYIDGKIPFAEMNAVKIPFHTQWQMIVPGGVKDPCLIYLTKGKHTLKLEVTPGELSPILLNIKNLVDEFTEVYRNILVLVGPNPDVNRDYSFESAIPEDLKKLKSLARKTRQIREDFLEAAGLSGQQAQALLNLVKVTEEMYKRPDLIPKKFTLFNSYISSLGTLLAQICRQPVEIDYISVISPDQRFDNISAGFLTNLVYGTKQFIASFFTDYASIGAAKESAIKVWIGNGSTGGRDQATVLNSMITNYFTSREDINVNLQLVAMNALLPATLADKGPDVALTLGQNDPVNFAIRGAVTDLTRFENFAEVKKRFAPETFTPLSFDGKVYGLPETQQFPMLFYRTDIFAELDLDPPKTWDDVVTMISTLEKKNLKFGMPLPFIQGMVGVGINPFAVFLYQNGGKFYDDENKSSALSSPQAVKAFYQWTRFYTDYGLPYAYDGTTRFRTGEMPIIYQDYSFYNAISVAAPELNGKWDFALIPGTVQPDGSINNTSQTSVQACVIMEKCKNKSAAWKFLDWWTSGETQGNFGREVESILGTAARYQTANTQALDQIPWNSKDYEKLTGGRDVSKGIPEVPGSYMTGRYLDFAVKNVIIPKPVSNKDNTANLIDPGRIISDAEKLITAEMKIKRREFGLKD